MGESDELDLMEAIRPVLQAIKLVKRADSEILMDPDKGTISIKGYWVGPGLIRLDIQGEEEQFRLLLEHA